MSNILLVLSSPRGEEAYSTQVARDLVAKLRAGDPAAVVTVRDVARDPLPHVGEAFVNAIRSPTGPSTEAERAVVEKSNALVDELLAADVVVIAAPMYNFGVPSTLKAWIDHVARAGRTFRYTENGPEGLAKDKRAFLVLSRGGVYSTGPAQRLEHQGTYLRALLGFLGITDVRTIDIEGVAFGPEAAERALNAAHTKIPTLLTQAA